MMRIAAILPILLCLLMGGCSAAEEDGLINEAIGLTKDWYKAEYELAGTSDEGYFEIVHTQVVYIKDEITVDERFAKAAGLFDDVDAIVEFVVLDDLYGTAPYYFPSYGVVSVKVYKDGSMEPFAMSVFNRYRGTTYTNDLTPIIESISDRNGEFNGSWHLLK